VVGSVPLSIAAGCFFLLMSNSLHESEPVVGAGVSMATKEGFIELRGQTERRRRTSKCR
jgi:hypothetical protein